jgi:hypothetical protein
VTAFRHPTDFAAHLRQSYGPTPAALGNARANNREAELVGALDGFYRSANSSSEDRAYFEMEYLLAVGRTSD